MLDVETFREGFQILPPSSCYIKMGRHGGRRLAPIRYRLVTFAACRPLGPEVTSNSTAWPSFSDLYPSAWMAEKWTKTSSPDWRWMNPKPLLALNHFTVPCSLTYLLTFILSYLCFSTASSRKAKGAASVNLQPLQSNLKVLQEQQTHLKVNMI